MINIKNNMLIEAVKLGNLSLVKKLIESGADVHARKDEALRYASYDGHTEIVDVLKAYYIKNNLQLPKGY